MALRVGKGKSMVTIEGALADGLEAELRTALGPVGDAMQAEADRIVREAKADWPVKSGRSRDAWRTDLRIHPGSFEVDVYISNPYSYTRYVKSTKVGKEDDATRLRSPFQTLVRKPARAADKELAKVLPSIIARALEGADG